MAMFGVLSKFHSKAITRRSCLSLKNAAGRSLRRAPNFGVRCQYEKYRIFTLTTFQFGF